jgi:glycoside/pentoside/hexuronide:cation symporter, GPH family
MSKSDGHRLPWRVRLLYGAGDLGLVLPMQMAGLMLLFFFTQVLGLDPALAGTLILIGLVFDAVTDVIMGIVADRMRARLGGYRPWLLIGAPLLGLTTALLFWAPPASGASLIALVIATQFLFRGAFTIAAIPFVSLSSALTPDSRERSLIVGIRLTGSTLASLLVVVLAQPLIAALGQGDEAQGFFWTAAVFGAVGAGLILAAWAVTRGWEQSGLDAHAPYALKDLPAMVARNPPFLMVVGLVFCQQAGQSLVLTGAPFFFAFSRGEPNSLGLSLGVLVGGVAVFVPVWTVIARAIGKRAAWLIGASLSGVALFCLAALSQAALPLFLGAMALSAFGFAALGVTSFSMLPDTVEYGEWKAGRRAEAALVSALTFAQKCAMGAASWTVGMLLALAGHSAAAPMTGPAAVNFGVLLFVIPGVLVAASLAIAAAYPITTAYHARLVRALAWKRRRR